MMSAAIISAGIALYLAVLVVFGWWAEQSPAGLGGRWMQPVLYGLSLATLCSAWTYFGAVGDASGGSWLFVANAVGPIIAITVFYPVWRRIALLSKQENLGSIADFLAARYGKSRALGIVTACVASSGALPYIALQLTVLTKVWAFATGTHVSGPWIALALVSVLAAMAIVFGARRPSLSQQNRGMVAIIAIESCVKLAALVGVAIVGLWFFSTAPDGLARALRAVPRISLHLNVSFITLVLLCTVTAFTLPRQFHLGFVTLERVSDTRAAIWVVPVYFGLWVAATLVIALSIRAGQGLAGGDPYLQVLAVPLLHGGQILSMLALLGGLSAGAAMVIVETTAISAMVSNEIILPLFARSMRQRRTDANLGRSIQRVRRLTIIAIALLAWCYYLGIGETGAPTQLGLTALAAFAQLLPALIGGIYWRGGHARGAIAGIGAGVAVWVLTIVGPAFVPHMATSAPVHDPLWAPLPELAPELAVFASLFINLALYVLVSLRSAPRLIDTIQANHFVASSPQIPRNGGERIRATIGDMRNLLTQFLGREEAEKAMLNISIGARAGPIPDDSDVSPTFVRSAERVLAGVIGAPSARNVVAIAMAVGSQDERDISRILDEAGHAVHFGRELLQTTLDSLPHGVSVVDAELRLVAWNARFLDFIALPLAETFVGKALRDLRDGSGAGGEGANRNGPQARKALFDRIATLAEHREFHDEIQTHDGRVLRLSGFPLPGDDFLTTITDITDLRQAELVLARSNEDLETLVQARTRELVAANAALAAAKLIAEQATGAQRRFVAAASHDLVQPMHAARLFLGNAMAGAAEDPALTGLLHRADQAVEDAHRLLKALLNLSQLEIGALQPNLEPVDAGLLLALLVEEFAGEARVRGLELHLLATQVWVRSDRDLLRSMLQNLLLNALRYTATGRVVIAVRRAGGYARFEVRDSGIGIAPDKLPSAFGEYSRLAEGRSMSEGAGLGLSIVARIAQVLDHPVSVRSRPGSGSVFSILLPITEPARPMRLAPGGRADLAGLRVLCVDDERDVLFGTAALIERWGGAVTALASAEAALAIAGEWDVAIADYHLGGMDGLALLRAVKSRVRSAILITATPGEGDLPGVSQEGIVVLAKPVAPLALQAQLMGTALAVAAQAEGGARSRDSASN